MRWPWTRLDEPEPGVTSEDRARLEQLRRELAERHNHVDILAEEVNRQAKYLRREKDKNHIADRFRAAFQGR